MMICGIYQCIEDEDSIISMSKLIHFGYDRCSKKNKNYTKSNPQNIERKIRCIIN